MLLLLNQVLFVATLLLFLLSDNLRCVSGTVYIGQEEYQSAPALFGKAFMPPEKLVTAHLQFLPHNPKLCDKMDYGNPLEGLVTPKDDDENLPIVLLAERGLCSFEEKAITAMQAYPDVEYVIVYDDIPRSTLVTMGGETFDQQRIDVGLLFVSNFAGHRLQDLISQMPLHKSKAGIKIYFDGVDPHIYEPLARIEKWILMAMGGFFTIVTGFGCIIIFIQLGIIPTNASGQLIIANTVVAQTIRTRHLLTMEEVQQIQDDNNNSNNNKKKKRPPDDDHHDDHDENSNNSNSGGLCQDTNCSICLDDFNSTDSVLCLPCNHKFHTDCIVPWLTERHATCPLCKFDVLEYILAINSPETTDDATTTTTTTTTADGDNTLPATSDDAEATSEPSSSTTSSSLTTFVEELGRQASLPNTGFFRLQRLLRIGWSPVQVEEAVYAAEHPVAVVPSQNSSGISSSSGNSGNNESRDVIES